MSQYPLPLVNPCPCFSKAFSSELFLRRICQTIIIEKYNQCLPVLVWPSNIKSFTVPLLTLILICKFINATYLHYYLWKTHSLLWSENEKHNSYLWPHILFCMTATSLTWQIVFFSCFLHVGHYVLFSLSTTFLWLCLSFPLVRCCCWLFRFALFGDEKLLDAKTCIIIDMKAPQQRMREPPEPWTPNCEPWTGSLATP